jgi:hypothetical protein
MPPRCRLWMLGLCSLTAGAAISVGISFSRFAQQPAAPEANDHTPNYAVRIAAATERNSAEQGVPPEHASGAHQDVAQRDGQLDSVHHQTVLPAIAARMRDDPEPAPGHTSAVIPHPMDGTRTRMQAQHRLLAEIKGALAAQNFDRARSLLAQHDQQFDAAEAWQDLREGYQLISDCKQYPSPEARARGERFVSVQRGSTLRRAVRRACGVTRSSGL